MIDRAGDKIEMVCNRCGVCSSNKPYASEDFDIMLADAKANGWKIRKGPDTKWKWVHFCATC